MSRLTEAPAIGSKWHKVSPTGFSADATIRVMGVVENYVVARRTGCAPFLVSLRDWPKQFTPAGRAVLKAGKEAG
jgi:hypothetical protein